MRAGEVLFEMSYPEALRIWQSIGVNVDDTASLSPTELKRKRREFMLKNHPDQGGNEEKAKLVNAAYDVLSNPTTARQSSAYGSSARPNRAKTSQASRNARADREDREWQGSRRSGAKADADEDTSWAQAGWSGGMPNSSNIYRQDYQDMNFIKKRMWELSGKSRQQWTIWGFDGAYLRNCLTVYGSPAIFKDMAEAMFTWQTKGGNPYRCRAVLVNKRNSKEFLLIYADDVMYADKPVEVESDSHNANPGNDTRFCDRLRKLLDDLQSE